MVTHYKRMTSLSFCLSSDLVLVFCDSHVTFVIQTGITIRWRLQLVYFLNSLYIYDFIMNNKHKQIDDGSTNNPNTTHILYFVE